MENVEGTFRQISKEDSPLKGSLLKDLDSIAINQNSKIMGGESVVRDE